MGFELKTRKGSVVEGELHLKGFTVSLKEEDHTDWMRRGSHEGRWRITIGDPGGKLPSGLLKDYAWVTYTTDTNYWRWASVHLRTKSDKVICVGPGGWDAHDGYWNAYCFKYLLKTIAEALIDLLKSEKSRTGRRAAS